MCFHPDSGKEGGGRPPRHSPCSLLPETLLEGRAQHQTPLFVPPGGWGPRGERARVWGTTVWVGLILNKENRRKAM